MCEHDYRIVRIDNDGFRSKLVKRCLKCDHEETATVKLRAGGLTSHVTRQAAERLSEHMDHLHINIDAVTFNAEASAKTIATLSDEMIQAALDVQDLLWEATPPEPEDDAP